MQKMRNCVMRLNRSASIDIDRYTHRFSRLGCSTLQKPRTMNKSIAALLCVDHSKLTNFRAVMSRHVPQPVVANLSTHLAVKRRLSEYDVYPLRIRFGTDTPLVHVLIDDVVTNRLR